MGDNFKSKNAKREFDGAVGVEEYTSVTDHLDETDFELLMMEAKKRAREKIGQKNVARLN